MRRLIGFGVVGGIGFIVDGGMLTLLVRIFGLDIYVSRAASFMVAVFVTWLLNRTFVFQASVSGGEMRGQEYVRYLSVQVIGALLNLGVFVALIHQYPDLRAIPIVPLAAGSAVGMIFNYAGSRYWVFDAARSRQRSA